MEISAVTPQLRTTDIEESIEFYTAALGFTLEFRFQDFYAGISVNGQSIHLKLVDEVDPSIEFVDKGNHLHLYFSTDDATALATEYKAKGLKFHNELAERRWKTLEFAIKDNQGHILYFGQDLNLHEK